MLVEAASTMLIFSKSSLFLWAEAVATTCYTQNRSLIHTRYKKTPYELLRDRKPNLKYLNVFGTLCYPTNDSEDLGKQKPKSDIRIFIGPELQPLTSGHINLGLVQNQAASTLTKPPSKNDLDLLFQPMFDEYFEQSPSVVSMTVFAETLLPPDTTEDYSFTTIDPDAPFLSTTLTTETTVTPLQSTNVEEPNNENAKFENDTFINPFSPRLPS
ncbi:retrovirus-related pol polyprotein from transposon TNT 1-94 [Tanacetum coccineum]